ncbi:MAG TPA: hypothetical protein VIH87_15410 [Methylocella sp.]
MAALSVIKAKRQPLCAFYERLRANGKPFKVPIVAIHAKAHRRVERNDQSRHVMERNPLHMKHSCSGDDGSDRRRAIAAPEAAEPNHRNDPATTSQPSWQTSMCLPT